METKVFWFFIGLGCFSLLLAVQLYLWRKRNKIFRNALMVVTFVSLLMFIVAALLRLGIL